MLQKEKMLPTSNNLKAAIIICLKCNRLAHDEPACSCIPLHKERRVFS